MNQQERKAAITALQSEMALYRSKMESLALAISVLGGPTGVVAATGTATGARKGQKKGGWPKGMKRGPRKPQQADSSSTEAATGQSTAQAGADSVGETGNREAGADNGDLQAALKAISARTDLTPIQKANESRKVRRQFKGQTEALAPEQGTLAEAAAV